MPRMQIFARACVFRITVSRELTYHGPVNGVPFTSIVMSVTSRRDTRHDDDRKLTVNVGSTSTFIISSVRNRFVALIE